jgi:ABC-type polysaccharide/polyol phosphate transport system ATPase subunit
MTQGRPAIEVRDLCKSFRMRTESGAGGRLPRVRARGYRFREVPILEDVSFTVGHGELFGVIGRNGSGKSTLLKILASIYDYDSGSVRIDGRLAPFVELGVGFHPELTAWHNVCTNAVMMGLTPEQARERFDRILEFAELEEFRGLELKNYSAGMRMRLAFATLLEVDADILLIDEVLAVGDARFREKCSGAFARLRERGRTIVIVSHSLGDIKRCDRALLLHEGAVEKIGDPEQVTAYYLELQGAKRREAGGAQTSRPRSPADPDEAAAKITALWLEDPAGRVASAIPSGERPHIHALIEARQSGRDPALVCEIHDNNGGVVRTLDPQPLGGPDRRLRPGDRLHAQVPVEGDLPPGVYIATCRALRINKAGRMLPMTESSLLDFTISRAGRTRPAPLPAGSLHGGKKAARL